MTYGLRASFPSVYGISFLDLWGGAPAMSIGGGPT